MAENYDEMKMDELIEIYKKKYETFLEYAQKFMPDIDKNINIPKSKKRLVALIKINDGVTELMKLTGKIPA